MRVFSVLGRGGLASLALFFVWSCLLSPLGGQETPKLPLPTWIWLGNEGGNDSIAMRKTFEIEGDIQQAYVVATADNHCEVFINNRKATSSDEWSQLASAEVSASLKQGTNVVSMTAKNDGGPAGAVALLHVKYKNGTTMSLVSDGTWKGTTKATGQWKTPNFKDQDWNGVKELGKVGQADLAWSGEIKLESFVDAMNSGGGGEFRPVIAENAKVPDGFKIEKIFQCLDPWARGCR